MPHGSTLFGPDVPAHYHCIGGLKTLVGHRDNEPWFGTRCPEACPQPDPKMQPMEPFWALQPVSGILPRLAPFFVGWRRPPGGSR